MANTLAAKRFLIVLDDIHEARLWHEIKELFMRNRKSSAIIITTNIKSVASSCRGQLYAVRGLSDANSRLLFWQKVEITRSVALDDALHRVFDTCEGSPVALISVANHFLEKGKAILTIKDCEEEGLALGRYLIGEVAAVSYNRMRRSLNDCYCNLPDYTHRMCLISLCMFPKGQKVRTKSLQRELIASGLIAGGSVMLGKENLASICLKKLIDQGLIEPVNIGIDYEVKTFQIGAIMLEFIIYKAAHKNFATLIHNGNRVPKFTDSNSVTPVRRLSIDGGAEQVRILVEEVGLSTVRWLRICNSEVLLDLENCQLLRVLDLEGSSGIDKEVMEKICQLQFLKYLGLRRSDVAMVPRSISKLNHLETLDCRETLVEALPIEVFQLPGLVYLFGRFELPLSKKRATVVHLHTLAGVVISDWEAFDRIMQQAGNQLKKLKIWCPDTARENKRSHRKRIEDLTHNLTSLSIDSTFMCTLVIFSLTPKCTISTLKLRGPVMLLPDAADLKSFAFLKELQLVNSGLWFELLSALQKLPALVYLKLGETYEFRDGQFTCQKDGFKSLQRLCFEAKKLPEMVIEHGGMPCLSTLDLLCPEYSSSPVLPAMTGPQLAKCFSGIDGLCNLENLKEIMLHPETDESKLKRWEEVCVLFKNRPLVKRQEH